MTVKIKTHRYILSMKIDTLTLTDLTNFILVKMWGKSRYCSYQLTRKNK
jgi:hypothetical protein